MTLKLSSYVHNFELRVDGKIVEEELVDAWDTKAPARSDAAKPTGLR
jgi:hypothetical protein